MPIARCASKPTAHALSARRSDTGRLEDGTVFDSSADRGPIEFTLGAREVIRGWDEGVASMRVGGRRQLVIPPHLGYGARACRPPARTSIFSLRLAGLRAHVRALPLVTGGAPPAIPPNALLHFDVELVAVGSPGLLGRLATLAKALPFVK